MGFPQPPEFTLYISGLVHTFSVLQAHPLCQGACVHLFPLPRHALFFVGFLFTCLSFPSPPSALWGLCALVLAPLVCFQLHRVCVHFCQLPVSALHAARFVCPCFSHQPALFVVGFMCSSFGSPGLPSVPRGFCSLPKFVCLSLSLHPGLPFALRGLCAFPRICMPCHTPGPPLCQKGCMCWRG